MEYFLEIDNDSMFCAQGYGKKILKITRMSQIEPMNHFVQSRYARNMRYVLNTFQGFSRQMLLLVLAVSVGFFSSAGSFHRQAEEIVPSISDYMMVGVAQTDITPDGPIRLAGYGGRKTESEGVLYPLKAKALAFGTDEQGPSVLITVDLIGIPGHVTAGLEKRLSAKKLLDRAHVVICASHTHGGPEVGNLLNHFGESLPPLQLAAIDRYLQQLEMKLEALATAALDARAPAQVSWGQGKVAFAVNRRVIKNGKWVGGGVVPGGPVDHSMPLLCVRDLNGNLRAVLVNYACHATTLGDLNKVHGDWVGLAQQAIESRHEGVVALVAVGCGADLSPEPRYEMQHVQRYGNMIADETDRLLKTRLQPLVGAPVGRHTDVRLPFAHIPTVDELVIQSAEEGAKGYYARLSLDRLARGETIPPTLSYPIKTWTFGDDLAMVFLAGEVVVDYALRLKKELRAERLWVNAYANDVPCYIASRRVIIEGGYEAESSMYSYDKPSAFSEEVEDLIVTAVVRLLPASFKSQP